MKTAVKSFRRVALITGSTRGIGRGIADALGEQGFKAVYSGTSAERPANIPQDGGYVGCDVAEAAQRRAMIERVLKEYGRLDVLVNNAGIAPLRRADILETTEESFDRVMSVNLKGAFFLSQLAAKAMIALQGELREYRPRIVNIGSISAYTSSVNRGEYCVSKAGLAMVTQLFADRLAEYGIPVFEIRPGIIETDMTEAVHEKYARLIEQGISPIRRFGQPGDVAAVAVAACSGLLDFSTGQVLNADGGFHIRRL